MTQSAGPTALIRYGYAAVQSVVALVGAGSIIYGAHRLFLSYFAREWGGLMFAGVNGCAHEEAIVDADLFDDAVTLCNRVENYVPWVEIYRRHWQVAAAYYGAILLGIAVVGVLVFLLQRRLTRHAPFGEPISTASLEASEHLN